MMFKIVKEKSKKISYLVVKTGKSQSLATIQVLILTNVFCFGALLLAMFAIVDFLPKPGLYPLGAGLAIFVMIIWGILFFFALKMLIEDICNFIKIYKENNKKYNERKNKFKRIVVIQ